MDYTVYNRSTGQVLWTGECPEEHFAAQVPGQGNDIAEGSYSDSEYYWDNGFIAIPDKPDGYWKFDYATKQWVSDGARAIALGRIKRNELLSNSDWTQVSDNALTTDDRAMWATYRKALRDMTEDDFKNGMFPVAPTKPTP